MTQAKMPRFTLNVDGHRFEVETASSGLHTVARLLVDGQQVDEQKGMEKAIQLEGGGLIAVVSLNWLGQATEILAVPSGVDPKKAQTEGIAFSTPPGSHAAKLETMRNQHPVLYAARHVIMAILQVLVGVLGVGALVWGLPPRTDFPAIPMPDLPSVPWPELPLPPIDLPDLSHLAWIRDLWRSVNWLVPIVIAIVVALNEIDKRRKRETARRQDGKGSRGIEESSRSQQPITHHPSPIPRAIGGSCQAPSSSSGLGP